MSQASQQQNRLGPDLFGHYVRELAELLVYSSVADADDVNMPGDGKAIHDIIGKNKPLFRDIVGNSMSEVNKESFKLFLKETLNTLTMEVDEKLDPVIRLGHIMFHMRAKKQEVTMERPLKMQKINPKIPSSNNFTPGGQVDETLKFLIDSEDSRRVEQKMKKHSDELSSELHYMEQRLEELLNIAVSQFRSMTHMEKKHLTSCIRKLPSENLERVVAIISQSNGVSNNNTPSCSDEIFVELAGMDTVTLWRIYFYVKAVENARKLSQKQLVQ